MKKTVLYRLFGFGSVPGKLRPVIEQEGILVLDEGMSGWFIAKHVDGPGKRYRHRSEGFSGCLAVTNERVVGYAYWKRQIHIATKDPRLAALHVEVPERDALSLSFEASLLREGWKGVIGFRFHTDKASRFRDALVSLGATPGQAAEAGRPS